MRFNDATWREIYEVRARLEAYKNKVQPYPAEEQALSQAEGQVSPPATKWSHDRWDKIQQIRAEVEGWRQKHAEALLAIDKLTAQVIKKRGQY